MSQRPPFPLAWPEDWARTPARNRTRSRFKVRLASAVATIHDELRQMPFDAARAELQPWTVKGLGA